MVRELGRPEHATIATRLASPPDRSGPRRAFSPILFEELRLQKPKIHIFDHLQLQMPQH